MTGWYEIRARGTGAEVAIYDEIGAYGVSAKGFLAELGALLLLLTTGMLLGSYALQRSMEARWRR